MEPLEAVPASMLYFARASGGIVLGAYDRGTLAGFVLGIDPGSGSSCSMRSAMPDRVA
ncbi:MAG TPA: hypothetical protein VNL71_13225 [Chloroflexota bacterium]|nr:hypothetical protein [Chloroflexota bacterium]